MSSGMNTCKVHRLRRPLTISLLFLICNRVHGEQLPLVISTPEEIAQEFQHVPCSNKEWLNGARDLFERMQAPASAIAIDKLSDVNNLVVRHQGSFPQTIVIGAHYDFAEVGCGAVDNWSGVVAIAHLYRSIRTFTTRKNVLFVAFGKEEKGLIGSKAMVNKIPKDELPNYCTMINVDSFGLALPFALERSSSKKLMTLATDISKTMQIPFATVIINGDSDSSSFISKKIPAITLSGLSRDWQSVLHTASDQSQKVNPTSVYLGYRLALTLWSRIEEDACDAYR